MEVYWKPYRLAVDQSPAVAGQRPNETVCPSPSHNFIIGLALFFVNAFFVTGQIGKTVV